MNTLPKHLQPDYLDLLEKTLLYWFWKEQNMDWNGTLQPGSSVSEAQRESGQTAWPSMAFTMINRLRLRNIRDLIGRAVADKVPGAFVECGVWRGGACIYARACLPMDRVVHVCDSFTGFPPDEPEVHWTTYKCLAVPQAEIMDTFGKFGLLEGVNFVGGYFKESLVRIDAPIAVLRIDADSERSTMDCLTNLWPKLSVGGYIICDDYKVCGGARNAFRNYFGVEPPVNDVDVSAVWFQKQS